jgi:hypothetical protein
MVRPRGSQKQRERGLSLFPGTFLNYANLLDRKNLGSSQAPIIGQCGGFCVVSQVRV